ncbi:MAG TPA: IS66 family transposase [Methylomirabilota bacterium]
MREVDLTIDMPQDLASCQTLIGRLASTIDTHLHTIDHHSRTIEKHSRTIEKHSRTIDDHLHTIESHAQTILELEQRNEKLEQEKQDLELAFNELLQRAFHRRSERYLEDPQQLKIDFGNSEEAADAAEGLAQAALESQEIVVPEHTRRRQPRKTRHEKLPEHLPRYEVEAEVPDERKTCPEHGQRKLIGYDRTETLEFERPKLKVRVTLFPKYACEDAPECGVASPERPTGLVEGDKYDTSVAAEIITGKYGFHLPIYRQQDYFAGTGWTPARSTLLNILEASAFVIRPVAEYFKQTILTCPILGTDDTRVTLLLPAPLENIPQPIPGDLKSQRIYEVFSEAVRDGKPSVSGRMWAYRSVTIPLNVFDFTVSRHRDGPDAFLEDYTGKLMADCYSAYQGITLRSEGRIGRGACVAHARRKVFDARGGYALDASFLLGKFQQLYDIEHQAKNFSADERLTLRQREAAPVWNAIGQWLESDAAKRVLPKSKLGEALGYLRNHWDPLRLYLTDGLMPIDNNDVEQLMKQVALGRKNWLFIGSVEAGERAADFLTLVSSAVRNDLDVWTYIKDVLDQLLAGSTDYEPLRPDIWKAAHPEAVRQYRAQERRDRAERKGRRRAHRRIARQPALR